LLILQKLTHHLFSILPLINALKTIRRGNMHALKPLFKQYKKLVVSSIVLAATFQATNAQAEYVGFYQEFGFININTQNLTSNFNKTHGGIDPFVDTTVVAKAQNTNGLAQAATVTYQNTPAPYVKAEVTQSATGGPIFENGVGVNAGGTMGYYFEITGAQAGSTVIVDISSLYSLQRSNNSGNSFTQTAVNLNVSDFGNLNNEVANFSGLALSCETTGCTGRTSGNATTFNINGAAVANGTGGFFTLAEKQSVDNLLIQDGLISTTLAMLVAADGKATGGVSISSTVGLGDFGNIQNALSSAFIDPLIRISTLNANASNLILNITAGVGNGLNNPSAVPLPNALWLFGTAILGFGIQRRRVI
jgi:hypothetical protein